MKLTKTENVKVFAVIEEEGDAFEYWAGQDRWDVHKALCDHYHENDFELKQVSLEALKKIKCPKNRNAPKKGWQNAFTVLKELYKEESLPFCFMYRGG